MIEYLLAWEEDVYALEEYTNKEILKEKMLIGKETQDGLKMTGMY